MKKILLTLSLLTVSLLYGDTPVPRTVVALYDGDEFPDIWYTSVHQWAAMPIEHLGYRVLYHNTREGYPEVAEKEEVFAVLSWQLSEGYAKDRIDILPWLLHLAEKGKRIIILGELPWKDDGSKAKREQISKFWEIIGLRDYSTWVIPTYEVTYPEKDWWIVGFERDYVDPLFGYYLMDKAADDVTVHLAVEQGGKDHSVVMATGPRGSYIGDYFSRYLRFGKSREYRKWYINPFAFFRMALSDGKFFPKGDVTTIAGRRTYYSHIDGDGWNNMTEVPQKENRRALSSEVIYEQVIAANPDLPVTVAPIAADLDPSWVGFPLSQTTAEKIFALPNVEPSSHTYSHPFDWHFFEHYNPEAEIPYLSKYPLGSWQDRNWADRFISWLKNEDGERRTTIEEPFRYPKKKLGPGYVIPRAFANKPFDINEEIGGSVDYISHFTKNKKIRLIQWSGNCQPFPKALLLTRERGLYNINGGDSRLDADFDSYAWVLPLIRRVGGQVQIYASMSNENTYTNMWTSTFYGFSKLPETLRNTDIPFRIRPINLYYHMYSGEKLSSLNALLHNIAYVKNREIAPITATHFSQIVEGFDSLKLILLEEHRWQISDRGALQTVRFDSALLQGVDFARSEGVIGQRHLHGSLYIYLDEAVENPIIALKAITQYAGEPDEELPYLIASRWLLKELKREGSEWSFTAQGFGPGEFLWKVPADGEHEVAVEGEAPQIVGSSKGLLTFITMRSGLQPLAVKIRRVQK